MKNTVKNQVEIILAVVISLFITLLSLYWLKADFLFQRKNLESTASHSFLKAIDAEKAIKLSGKEVSVAYKSYLSPDTISFIEKNNWCDQSFFIKHDSTRQTLDRLFRAELKKKGIAVQVGIRFLWKEKTVYSNPDSLFYQQATILPAVVYRLNEKPEGRCELQAYVKLPFLIVLKQMYSVGFLLLIIFIITGAFLYSRKNRAVGPLSVPTAVPEVEEAVVIPVDEESNAPVVENTIIQLIEPDVAWTCLTEDLYFDEKLGVLKYKDQLIVMRNNRLLLFRIFLNAPHHYLNMTDIYEPILGHKVNKATKSENDAIAATIKRLRNDLKPCPLKIENIRGNGYRLIITPDKETQNKETSPVIDSNKQQ